MLRRLLPLLLLAGCIDSIPARTSPFALFGRDDMRAGLRYEIIEESTRRESSQPLECVPLWARARRCSVRIETAVMSAVVDSTGCIVRIVVSPDEAVQSGRNMQGQLVLREALRDMRTAWDSVAPSTRGPAETSPDEHSWRSGRWGAAVWLDPVRNVAGLGPVTRTDAELAMAIPDSFGVTDLPAYSLLMQLRPEKPARRGPSMAAVVPPPPPPTAEQLVALMRSDLRELTIMQETAFHNTGRYERTLDRLRVSPSDGVRVQLLTGNEEGWSAVATHPSLPGRTCVVYAGIVADQPRTHRAGRRAGPGEIACDDP